MAFKAGEVVIDIHGNVIPLRRDMLKGEKIVKKSTTKMSHSMNKVSKSAGLMGKSMVAALGGVALGAGIIMAGRAMLRVGADFERSMATVRGVTRATDKQFAALSATAKRLGETTEFTAAQAAGGLKFLGMAGFSAEKAIAALPGVLDLATAGGLELGRAADIVSNALTAMQLEVGELGRVNDVFIATITRSNTNMEMMADSFRYAAPKARAYGYSIEQLSGMIGALGNAGIQGSMAGTQLSFAISRVDKVSKKLGLGSGAKLIDVLRGMNAAGWSAAQVMDAFGERGGRAALVLKGIIPDVQRLTAANYAAEGEAKKLAETMRATVTGAFLELKSAIQVVAIDAFTGSQIKLADQIRSLTETVRDNKDAWISLAEGLLAVTGFFISLAAAAGRALQAVTSGGTDLYKRFKRLQEVGFLRAEDWQREAAEGTVVLEEFIANAERLMKKFGMSAHWSDYFLPDVAKLRDSWANVYGVLEFKVKVVPVVEQAKKLSKFDQGIEDLKSPGAAAEWAEMKLNKETELMNERIDAEKETERILNGLRTEAAMEEVRLAEEKLREYVIRSNEEIGIEKKAAKEIEDLKRQSIENIAGMMSDRGTDAFMAMIEGTKSMTEAFAEMAKSILHDLARMIIKQILFNALMKAGESVFGLGPKKEGAVFSSPITTGFRDEAARGAVVNSPTMFAHGGGVGIMGEAGPEAILPLTRTSKGLGVVAAMPQNDSGGNGRQINLILENVNINAVDSISFQELTERNPDAILQPFKTALTEGDTALQSLLKE